MSLLALESIHKSFGAVRVLHGVSLTVAAGEVVGLVGDNGAGKSTLMKCITGMYRSDFGEIRLNGESITHLDPGERRRIGVEMIYQDLSLAKQQDVASNIFLGREPTRSLFGLLHFVDRKRMNEEALTMIERLGAHLPSIHRPVGSFSGGQQQTVAIARALTFDPKLVIMDEPTAALAVREVQSVLGLIERLKSQSIAVILISHRLNDVMKVTDRVVVLRQGRVVADLATRKTDMNQIVARIVGGDDAMASAHEARG